jgi:branched-chain amino acid transport system substrate-binding protein
MTIRTRTRVLSRRNTLLGSATMASLPLSMPFISKAGAADPIRIGLLLAKTGQIAPQTEYLAQGACVAG